jgi:hypothetical protein
VASCGSAGTTSARSFAFGASTHGIGSGAAGGRGTSAARRCMNSSGDITMCVVAVAPSGLELEHDLPGALSLASARQLDGRRGPAGVLSGWRCSSRCTPWVRYTMRSPAVASCYGEMWRTARGQIPSRCRDRVLLDQYGVRRARREHRQCVPEDPPSTACLGATQRDETKNGKLRPWNWINGHIPWQATSATCPSLRPMRLVAT